MRSLAPAASARRRELRMSAREGGGAGPFIQCDRARRRPRAGFTRAGIWVLFVLAAANGAVPLRPPRPRRHRLRLGDQTGRERGVHRRGIPRRHARHRARAGDRDALARVLDAAARAVGARQTLLAATIIHADRFKWDYPLTWVWALVYAGVPLAVPLLVARQRRIADAEPHADPRLRALRVLSAIVGAPLLAGAVALFVMPDELGQHWPWELTPLLARAVAAWYALFGTMLVSCALELRRPAEAIIPYATLALDPAAARAAAAAPERRERGRPVDHNDAGCSGSRRLGSASHSRTPAGSSILGARAAEDVTRPRSPGGRIAARRHRSAESRSRPPWCKAAAATTRRYSTSLSRARPT